jgi:carbonic anhydrase
MSVIEPLLDRNRAFAASGAHQGLAIMPRLRAFVITCLDPRVDPAAFLGLQLGEAVVVRNAGGRITDEVINDVAFISYLAEQAVPEGPLFEVAVIHHTQCGTGALADTGFRRSFAERTGLDETALAAEAVTDPAATVRVDVERLLASPRVSPRISVSAHLYDVVTGLVTGLITTTRTPATTHTAGAVA